MKEGVGLRQAKCECDFRKHSHTRAAHNRPEVCLRCDSNYKSNSLSTVPPHSLNYTEYRTPAVATHL